MNPFMAWKLNARKDMESEGKAWKVKAWHGNTRYGKIRHGK
jgi:hypothetical protein